MAEEALQQDVRDRIAAKDFAGLKAALGQMEVHDLADLLADLEDDDLAVAFRLLGRDRATEVFPLLEADQQERLVTTLPTERVEAILQEMPPDDRTELLEDLPDELAQRLLRGLRGSELTIAQELLAYPEDSVGRLMTPEYIAVGAEATVEEAFAHIRKVGRDKETLYVVYVVDEAGRLLDEVRLEDIVLAEPQDRVQDLLDEQVVSLQADDDQETAVELMKKYDAVALPVVDRVGKLVGIVTWDDVIDVAEAESTEDMQLMTAMEPLEHGYFATSTRGMLRKRLPWLALLLGGQLLTTVALTQFYALPLFAVLALFMPLINSPAGNTGTQISAMILRSLAVAEMDVGDWWRVLLRELLRGLTLGAMLAVLGFAAAWAFAHLVDTQQHPPGQIALAVAVALALMVTLANVIGAMLPFFFKRLGLDPAVTSGPFIASVMDVTGILVYFSTGMLLLHAL